MLLYPTLNVCLANEPGFSCGLPDVFESNGDIAGLGVFIAFVIAAGFALAAGVYALYHEAIEYFITGSEHEHAKRARKFVDTFLISLGDTQIVTSIALLISTNFFFGCTISAYHYNLVFILVLISSAAHIGSMAFVHMYFNKNKILGGIRFVLILVTFVLAWLLLHRRSSSHIFPSFIPKSSTRNTSGKIDTGLVLPAACFIEHPGVSGTTPYSNFTASLYWLTNATNTVATNSSASFRSTNSSATFTNGTIMPEFQRFNSNDTLTNFDKTALIFLTIALGLTSIASGILSHYKPVKKNQYNDAKKNKWPHYIAYALRCLSFLIITGITIYGLVQFILLQNWMINSNWFGGDKGERDFGSFGQLIPLILLALPCLALAEEIFGSKDLSQKNDDDKGSTNSSYPMTGYGN